MMIMVDLVAIQVETPRRDNRYSLEKDFTKLICMNPSMVFYLIIN